MNQTRYVKLNPDGTPEELKNRTLTFGGRVYINPKEGILAAAGYKPLSKDPLPGDNGTLTEEGKRVVYHRTFRDDGDRITLTFLREEIPEDDGEEEGSPC